MKISVEMFFSDVSILDGERARRREHFFVEDLERMYHLPHHPCQSYRHALIWNSFLIENSLIFSVLSKF